MKTNVREVYRCSICGGVVEVLHQGNVMQCCGQPMTLLKENTTDGAREKHVPVVEPVEGGYRVVVGSTEHPMLAEHFIEWIELVTDSHVYRKELRPSEKPEAVFLTEAKQVFARAYCNLHGLWRN